MFATKSAFALRMKAEVDNEEGGTILAVAM